MYWAIEHLSELPPQVWSALAHAADNLQHPMRLGVLGTSGDLHASLRGMVLRKVAPARRVLVCHTDARSAKVRELRRNPQAQWLFYHPQEHVQIIAIGHAVIHQGDQVAHDAWVATPLASRLSYCSWLAPGVKIQLPNEAWPPWPNGTPTVAESEAGRPNFCVIEFHVEQMEWLQLRMEGHRRAAFTWTGKEFQGHWLVP